MTLQPILNSSLAIQVHVLAAGMAIVVGVAQLVLAKGTKTHRQTGWSLDCADGCRCPVVLFYPHHSACRRLEPYPLTINLYSGHAVERYSGRKERQKEGARLHNDGSLRVCLDRRGRFYPATWQDYASGIVRGLTLLTA